MGEMTIRIDDALLIALRERALVLGTDMERVAADLLQAGLQRSRADRTFVAREILARASPSPISSVELLDQIRDEGR